jgi:hypothetical protein
MKNLSDYRELTYSELKNLKDNEDLVPGWRYVITHTTSHRIGSSSEINNGLPEKLVLTAISKNNFDPHVVSIDNPFDEIRYNIDIDKIYDPLTNLVDFTVDGFITYRKDENGNEGYFDIRNYKVEVWPRYDNTNGNTYEFQPNGGDRHGYTFTGIQSTHARIIIPTGVSFSYDNSGILQIGSQTLSNLGSTASDIQDNIESQLISGPNDPAYISYETGSISGFLYVDIYLSSNIEITWDQNTDGALTIENREIRYAIPTQTCRDCKIDKFTISAEQTLGGGFSRYQAYPNNIILENCSSCIIGKDSDDCIISGLSTNCKIGNTCLDINITPLGNISGDGFSTIILNYGLSVGGSSIKIGDSSTFCDIRGANTELGDYCTYISCPISFFGSNNASIHLFDCYFAPGSEGVTIRKGIKLRWLLPSALYCSISSETGLIDKTIAEEDSTSAYFSDIPAKLGVNWSGGRFYRATNIELDPAVIGLSPYIQLSKTKGSNDMIRCEMESYFIGGIGYNLQFRPQDNPIDDWTNNTYTQIWVSGDGWIENNGQGPDSLTRVSTKSPEPAKYLGPDVYDSTLITLDFNGVTYPLVGNERIVINGTTYRANGPSDELSYTAGTSSVTDAANFVTLFNYNPPNDYLTGFQASGRWVAIDNLDGTVLLARYLEHEQGDEYKWPMIQVLGGNYFNSLVVSRDSYSDNGPWYFTRFMSISTIINAIGTNLVDVRVGVVPAGWSGKINQANSNPIVFSNPISVDLNSLPF